MAGSQNRSEDGGESRVQCLYCGANNFPSSPTCWQCGRPLKALHAGAPAAAGPGGRGDAGAGRPASAAFRSADPAVEAVSPTLAPKAAAALGLTFPYIGLPVGMVFLMFDDARRTQIGWITIGWSVAGTVINVLVLLATLGPTLALLKGLIPHPGHGGLPSLPSSTGDPGDLNIILPYFAANLRGISQASWHRLAFCGRCPRV